MSTEENRAEDSVGQLNEADLLEVLKESADEVFLTMIGLVGVLVDESCDDDAVDIEKSEGERVEYEAVVSFSGQRSGAVILRAGVEGALDITRGLLMLGEEDAVEDEEIMDALGECANMLTGSLKCKALDPSGGFTLSTPSIGKSVVVDYDNHLGGLVYRLEKGCTSVEIWLDEAA